MPFPVKPAAGKLLEQYLRKNVTSYKTGVVVSAGKMAKAVKVRVAEQEWNKHIRKYFPRPRNYLVADPNNSLVEGDIVRISSGWRFSKSIHHVVTAIVAPFGAPATDRPPVLTEEQLLQKRLEKRLEKDVRSAAAGRLTSKWRLKEAKGAGYQIPDLVDAMRNVRLQEEAEAAAEAHKGQAKQMLSAREIKRLERARIKEEKQAAASVKSTRKQKLEAKKSEEASRQTVVEESGKEEKEAKAQAA
ncbi:nucleic acid-binding protein [Sporormia fimetaria CBS 119925]|uniref:Nucleic acid-binding protein n=1 Tax=Sporormia fimetaria CBS 119925 TaxID=1340428 RepID=A0A6A6V8S4_9PLEO|nr:nucleic acid-binding protein [Sporormia fimetaria CBS 119925]